MIGQRFGNYRAVSLLGEGGMGAVYLAEHPEIGRRVAVKVLRPELIKDPQLLMRFLNEARAANAIRHPNIIEILDSGTTPEGTPYLVMELLEGEVLSGRIRRLGKLPLADALEFSYQAASALAAAHEKAIIHRDLKPDNLFIIRDPSDPARERMKVLDFGIAKLQTFPTGGGMQTRTGTLMGTPVYMSPEQCLGTKAIDQRSDIYAMGIIMFEMLSGRPPFLSEGFGELVNMHLNIRPPRLREIDPAISEPVEALVAKALEKAPDARQRSAAELQMDIRTAAGKSIVIRGASSPDLISATMPGAGAGARLSMAATTASAATTAAERAFTGSTTMTTGTGERVVTTMPVVRGSATRKVFLAVVLAMAAGAAVLVVSRRPAGVAGPGLPVDVPPSLPAGAGTIASADPKPAAPIRLTIHSQPPGAAVFDVASGQSLGTAPVVVERPATAGPVTVRVVKPGFATMTRTLVLDRDRTETMSLEALPPETEKPGAVGASEKPRDKPSARSKETSKETSKDKTKKGPRPHHPVVRPDDEPAKL